ncbi:hypothetical protein [Kineococcus sp. G2]|uniref:hypothetical protein n=1 Tax=Kineococcus sp. G2 TaxID=3127484 RepID=UPI00301DDE21
MAWEAVSAGAAVLAAGAAAWQLRQLRRDALEARAAEIASVSVATTVIFKPRDAEVREGRADWTYGYTINNPGRLPVSDVDVTIQYGCEVRRRRGREYDPPTSTLYLTASVVPPHSSHPSRERILSVAKEDWSRLSEATITVSFIAPDVGRCTTTWPARDHRTNNALQKVLTRR